MQREIEDSTGQVAEIYGVSKDEKSVMVQMQDKQVVLIPISALDIKSEQRYLLRKSFEDFYNSNGQVIPVIEEIPVITKKLVETGIVRLKKNVTTEIKSIEQTLYQENIEINRIPVNETREEPASIRTEGDVTIIPVQEEVLVIQKKFVVKEEIHIKKVKTERQEVVKVDLRKEDVTLDRKKIN